MRRNNSAMPPEIQASLKSERMGTKNTWMLEAVRDQVSLIFQAQAKLKLTLSSQAKLKLTLSSQAKLVLTIN